MLQVTFAIAALVITLLILAFFSTLPALPAYSFSLCVAFLTLISISKLKH
jgi:hypothetical protein